MIDIWISSLRTDLAKTSNMDAKSVGRHCSSVVVCLNIDEKQKSPWFATQPSKKLLLFWIVKF